MYEGINKLLEQHRNYIIDPKSLPKCLINYHPSESIKRTPIAKLVARLQYAKGLISEPFTLRQIQMHKDSKLKETNKLINVNANLYKDDVLREFIQPSNALKSMIEMVLHPDIVQILCEASVNEKLTTEEQQQCVALLKSFENPNDIQLSAMISAKATFEVGRQMSREIKKLETTIKECDKEIADLRTELEALKNLVYKNLKPEKIEIDKKKPSYSPGFL